MTTATAVMLSGPPDHRGRAQLALLLVENGRPAGGYQNGKAISVAHAQGLLRNPAWSAVAPIS